MAFTDGSHIHIIFVIELKLLEIGVLAELYEIVTYAIIPCRMKQSEKLLCGIRLCCLCRYGVITILRKKDNFQLIRAYCF